MKIRKIELIVVLLVVMTTTAGLVQVAYPDAAGDKDAATKTSASKDAGGQSLQEKATDDKDAATKTSASKDAAGRSLQQTPKHDLGDLAKQTQNPVADLISVPFQFNTFLETGPEARTQNTLLIEPVIPFHLNDEWNFIARPIITLIDSAPMMPDQARNFGMGNLEFEGFFTPKTKVFGDWTIGVGPTLQFPTNTGPDNRYGSDNWSAGPALLLMQSKGPWVFGGLLTQLWSYHGNDPEVNETSFQPFINYNMKDGWYLHSDPIISANWSADSSQQWTIPIGGGIGRVAKIGEMPVNFRVASYYNIESPRTGADWQVQFQIQFLFPE